MDIDIEHLEYLGKLKIEDDKKEKFKTDLQEILNFVDEITTLDLPSDDSENTVGLEDLREDECKKQTDFDALQNAPEKKDGYFEVPLVVE